MTKRSEPITRLPLIDGNTRHPRQSLLDKEAQLLEDLHEDVPILRHLRASVISTEYEVIGNGLWFVVSLEDAPQAQLPYPDPGRPAGTRVVDPFMEDLADVRQQIGRVEGRILIAISGAASPLDGTTDGPHASSTATVRRRVKRRRSKGPILIPGMPRPGMLFVEEPPKTLPRGPVLVISAVVKTLAADHAELVGIRVESPIEYRTRFKLSATRQLPLARVGLFQRAINGTTLQVAMDDGKRLRMEVIAGLEWASGKLVSFELRNFIHV